MAADTWPLGSSLTAFVLGSLLILYAGTRMVGFADRLADRTRLGEAIMGGLFLGISTSLSGISATVTATLEGLPSLAVSNAMGGIAAQTAFLAIADLFHRHANLEHAAASVSNMTQCCLLLLLLSFALLVMLGPPWTLWSIHPGTLLLIAAYVQGVRLVQRSSTAPMWHPKLTSDTIEDRPDPRSWQRSTRSLWVGFAFSALAVMVGGTIVARSAGTIAAQTILSESVMGGLFLAISTSLPELTTTVAAVRRGALTLAVSDIVGGNAFDVLFVCLADGIYREGSIYHAVGSRELYLTGLAILLNVTLLLGLLHRQKRGVLNIGFESIVILLAYLGGAFLLGFGFS